MTIAKNLTEQSEFYDEYWRELKPFGNYKIKRLAHILLYLELCKKKLKALNILDLGCGDGRCAAIWNEIGKTTGLDLSVNAMKNARQRYPFIDFHSGDATRTEFKDASFNTIITQEVIEHIIDQQQFINECHRLLSKDGMLILTTPNLTYFNSTISGNYSKQPIENIIDVAKLKSLLIGKFEIIKLETINFTVIDKGLNKFLFKFPIAQLLSKLRLVSLRNAYLKRNHLGLQICLLAQKIG